MGEISKKQAYDLRAFIKRLSKSSIDNGHGNDLIVEQMRQYLNLLEFTRNEIEVISTEDKDVLPGASDEDIATYIASQGGILFSKDQDFKKAQFLTELMSTLQLGLFYMKTQKKEEYWHLCSVILGSVASVKK